MEILTVISIYTILFAQIMNYIIFVLLTYYSSILKTFERIPIYEIIRYNTGNFKGQSFRI